MKLTEENRNIVVSLRLERSAEAMAAAKDNAAMEHWRTAANRLYYACYYAASALLIKHGHTAYSHSGVITMLGQHFVKNGIISKAHNSMYQRLMGLRQDGDYDDWFIIDPDIVRNSIAPAEEFIAAIKRLIDT